MNKSALRIAIFGNTNNYPLLLALGLKKLGHEVRLILNRKEILHRPEGLYPEWAGNYPEWILDCSNIEDTDIAFESRALRSAVKYLTKNVDLAILNDTGPSLAGYLKAPHIVFLTGSDLTYYANFDMLALQASSWSFEFKRSARGRKYIRQFADMVVRQRNGILGASVVCYPQRGLDLHGDKLLDAIGVTDDRRSMLYLANTIDLEQRPVAGGMRVLCGSRIVFKPERNPNLTALDFKGTDILIRGFALYCERARGVENSASAERWKLLLPHKGQDVEVATKLISELGIEHHIQWLNEMSLSDFHDEMSKADLICDQFGTAFPGMVTLDAYAMGRPVLSNLRNEVFARYFAEPLPGFDAQTPEEIADYLLALEQDRRLLNDMGEKSRKYAEKYLSPESMAQQLLDKFYQVN